MGSTTRKGTKPAAPARSVPANPPTGQVARRVAPEPANAAMTVGSRALARAQALEGVAARTGAKVRATKVGYYLHTRRRVGDVFRLAKASDWSAHWMERVGADVPESLTLPNEALRQEHDDILKMKTQPGMQVGPDNVGDVATGTRNPIGDD